MFRSFCLLYIDVHDRSLSYYRTWRPAWITDESCTYYQGINFTQTFEFEAFPGLRTCCKYICWLTIFMLLLLEVLHLRLLCSVGFKWIASKNSHEAGLNCSRSSIRWWANCLYLVYQKAYVPSKVLERFRFHLFLLTSLCLDKTKAIPVRVSACSVYK